VLRRLVLLALALALLGCKTGEGGSCQGADDCRSGLACFEARCVDSARHCRESAEHAEGCRLHGLCTLVDGACAAAAGDCEAAVRCRELGHCTASAGCCSKTGRCLASDEDPVPLVLELRDGARREEAIARLEALHRRALELDRGDRRGREARAVLEDAVIPLSRLVDEHALSDKAHASALALVAKGRRPETAATLVKALEDYRPSGPSATPLDESMAEVALALAELKPPAARAAVLRVFTELEASSRRAQAGGLAQALGRAVVALAEPSWEPQLLSLVERPITHGDATPPFGAPSSLRTYAWRNEVYWQTTAATALGRLRSDKALVPLVKVLLSPDKDDVAAAATAALVSIGRPASSLALELIAGKGPQVNAPPPEPADELDVPRSPAALRIATGATLLALIGRSDAKDAVLEAIPKTDDIGKGHVAMALGALPPAPELLDAYRKVMAEVPLDTPLGQGTGGAVPLVESAAWFFDPALVPWLVEWAQGLEGTDTFLAPFREAALGAVLRLVGPGQLDAVGRLAELVASASLQNDERLARALVARCGDEIGCYLEVVAEPLATERRFAHVKAAFAAGTLVRAKDASALVAAIEKQSDAEVRRVLGAALARVLGSGDDTLATRLEAVLDPAGTPNADLQLIAARLRARSAR
jgi:hypothetical protein